MKPHRQKMNSEVFSIMNLLEARKSVNAASLADIGLMVTDTHLVLIDMGRVTASFAKAPDVSWKNGVFDDDLSWSFAQERLYDYIVGGMEYTNRGTYLRVETVFAEKGFGPLLYLALSAISSTGWISPGSSVKPSARKVWKRFFDTSLAVKRVKKDFQDSEGKPDASKIEMIFKDANFLAYEYKPRAKINISRLTTEFDADMGDFFDAFEVMLRERKKRGVLPADLDVTKVLTVDALKGHIQTVSDQKFEDIYRNS